MHRLIELVSELGLRDHVLLSSFRIEYLLEAGWEIPSFVIHADEQMQMFFALRSYSDPVRFEKKLDLYLPSELMAVARTTGYACQLSELSPDALADVRRHNILLGVYTITTEEEFDGAVARGARALVCERPQEFVAIRNRRFPATLQ
jgi:glycerophosphoryl diester phosphodiesterase